MKATFVRSAALTLMLTLTLSACGNLFQREKPKTTVGMGTLSVSLRGQAPKGRTILPPAVVSTDLLYDLSLTRSGYTTINLSQVAASALVVSSIDVGDWALSVTGYKAGEALYAKSGTVTIVAGANAVSLALDPLRAGTGGIDVTITWPQDGAWPQGVVDGSLRNWMPVANLTPGADLRTVISAFPLVGGTITETYTGASPSLHIVNSGITSGDYYFVIALTRGVPGMLVASVMELVRVYDNQTSTATIALAATDLSSAPEAPIDCRVSFDADNFATFAWTDKAKTETGYHLYDGTTLINPDSGPSSTTYTTALGGYSPLDTYYISAFNSFGESARVQCQPADSLHVSVQEINQGLSLGYSPNGDGSVTLASTNSSLNALTGSWSWYVDGLKAQGEAASTFIFDPVLFGGQGDYIVSANVPYKGVLLSQSLMVTFAPTTPTVTTTWRVTYSKGNADGGEPPMDNRAYSATDIPATVLGAGTLTKVNATLIGWAKRSDPSPILYGPPELGSQPKTPTIAVGGDITFDPVWSSRKYILRTTGVPITLPVYGNANITVKAWGAGGGGWIYGAKSNGGAGGFAQSSFSASSGQTVYVSVGRGGGNVYSEPWPPSQPNLPAVGGMVFNDGPGGANLGGWGGDGSVVALFDGTNYSLEACGGGGGGASGSSTYLLLSGAG
ncbi:MAG: hypothetical protein WCL50_04800, partial [Spirochaetota bacterium]